MKKILTSVFLFFLFLASLPVIAARYDVIPGKNRARFTSDATLDTVIGETPDVSGWIDFTPSNLHGAKGVITVSLATLDTGNRLRDKHMREDFLETDKFPVVSFKLVNVDARTLSVGKNAFTAHGVFSLHGVQRAIAVPLKITREQSKNKMQVKTHFTVKLSEYGIKRPQMLLLKLSDSIVIDVSFTATMSNH